MSQPRYNIYATLLDSFQGWLSSSEIWHEYWSFSDDPSKTEEDFEKEQLQSLLNRINRVPLPWEDSEAADRGTAFNEVIDCLIAGRKSDKMEMVSNKETGLIQVSYNKRIFYFPIALCREFAEYYKNAVSQVYVEATLPTKYGDVLLYGYIDELMPSSVHDIKTTSKYKAGKFRNNWQHIVYPYCLIENGNNVSEFEYNVAMFGSGNSYSSFTEHYRYLPEKDLPRLITVVENLIDFIESNRNLITDKKIFNEL